MNGSPSSLRRRSLWLLAWTGVVLVALALRLHELSRPAVHFDEATGAWILAQRMEAGVHPFNPRHFHGPALALLAEPLCRLTGESGWQRFSIDTLRFLPALAGTLLVLCPLLLMRRLPAACPLLAGLLLALSPLLLYFSRIYIHETLLALFSLLALGLSWQAFERKGAQMAALAGVAIGLMWATKATFIITLVSWIGGGLCIACWMGLPDATSRRRLPIIFLTATGACLLTAGIIYSDFLTHPMRVLDAVRTYAAYEPVSGHEKPALWYLQLLLWPEVANPLRWSLWALMAAALAAGAVGILRLSRRAPDPEALMAVFLLTAGALQLLVYSLIPYKTPWLMVVPLAHFCLLAGLLPALAGRSIWGPVGIFFLILSSANQAAGLSGRFAGQHPYRYVTTSQDLPRLAEWLLQLQGTHSGQPFPIAVVGRNYWPLPWYLRPFAEVGYFPSVPSDPTSFAIILVLPEQAEPAEILLAESHMGLPRSLRENTPLMAYIRQDIWENWNSGGRP